MNAEDRTKIDEVKEYWTDYYSVWSPLFEAMSQDDKIYVGDQWNFIETRDMRNRPKISINIVKKHVDVQSGWERQNRTDIKVFPIEGADDFVCDVLSQVIKWTLGLRGMHQQLSAANKDCFIGGLGWYHPYMDFSEDIADGNIYIQRVDPYSIMFDPYSFSPDLSDCRRLLRWAYVEKDILKLNYPDKARDIENTEGSGELAQKYNQRNYRSDYTKRLNIREMWYKKPEPVKRFVDNVTGDMFDFEGDDGELIKQMGLTSDDNFDIIERQVDKMNLRIIAENDLVLYDGKNPYELNLFPFIPVIGYHTPSTQEFMWRFQGMVRALKDLQVEKNKRRSQLMDAALSMPYGIITLLKNSGIDINILKQPGPKILEVDSHDDLKEWPRQAFDQAFYQLEQLFTDDTNMVGSSPDLLGQAGGATGSAPSAPGISLQLRQRQAMTAIQEIHDNISNSKKQLGKYLVELILKHYSRPKIEKITGENFPYIREMIAVQNSYGQIAKQMDMVQDEQQMAQMQQQVGQLRTQMMDYQEKIESIWDDLEKARDNAIFDTKVDEIQMSPTYKIAVGEQLMQLAHQGFQIFPEVLMEYIDMPQNVKDLWKQKMAEQMQAAQASEEKKQQFELAKEKMKAEFDLQQAQISVQRGNYGTSPNE